VRKTCTPIADFEDGNRPQAKEFWKLIVSTKGKEMKEMGFLLGLQKRMWNCKRSDFSPV
jgi:hypothetical protein